MDAASPVARKVPPIRKVRLEHGLSLRELGRRAGVDHAQLGRIERGEAVGSVTTLRKLLEALGMRDDARRFAKFDPEAE